MGYVIEGCSRVILRVWGLVMLVVMVLVVVGTPTVLAEQWKTYYNPNLKLAIDYPLYSGPDGVPTNITETTNEVHFKLYKLGVTINANQDSLRGPEESAISMQETVLENWKDAELKQGVETVIYNGELGYGFIVFTPSNHLFTEMIYFHSPNDMYKYYDVSFVGEKTAGFPVMVDDFMNSIRFFD